MDDADERKMDGPPEDARVRDLEAQLAAARDEARQNHDRWLRERAVEHARSGGNGQPLAEGVALVLKSLLDVLERHGVTRVEAKGVPFDPAHHEAMGHVASDEHEPNVVVEEHQRGYRLNDRLLRPALVSVAKPAAGNLAKDKTRD